MFKDILKGLRSSKKITQEGLAKILGVERSTVGKWESKNIIPPADMLIDLAEFFDVTVDYLLGRTDIENNNVIPEEFITPEAAIKFILEQNVIMGFGGFDVNKMSDDEVVEFANELLNQLRLLSYKYKK